MNVTPKRNPTPAHHFFSSSVLIFILFIEFFILYDTFLYLPLPHHNKTKSFYVHRVVIARVEYVSVVSPRKP